MGTLARAHCMGCGYDSKLLPLGAGMFNFMDVCWMPASCPKCQQVVTIDVLAGRASCPACRQAVASYATAGGGEDEFSWRLPSGEVLSVLKEGNPCPACGAPLLQIQFVGNFD